MPREKKVYTDALHYVLTPLGLTFFLIGGCLKRLGREWFLAFWLLAVFVFYLLLPETVGVHSYYHIHYLPVACFWIARSYHTFSRIMDKPAFKPLLTSLGVVFLLLCGRYAIPFYWVPEQKRYIMKTAQEIQTRVPKGALIVASSDSPAAFLYYCDRKGWARDFSDRGDRAIPMLEEYRRLGARYFVSAHQEDLKSNGDFIKYARARYKTLYEDDFSWLIDLGE